MRSLSFSRSARWLGCLVFASALACSSGKEGNNNGNGGDTGGSTGQTGSGGGSPIHLGGHTIQDAGAGNNEAGASSTDGHGGTAQGANGGNVGTAGTGTAGITGTVTACNNGKDDDGDGLVDGFDPECTGPADNDEGTYATGIPGDNRDPKWQDCFFDGNSGAGDDDCRYATGCLDGTLDHSDPDCVVTDACVKYCAPLTQNGCDCFGCCTVQLGDGSTVDIEEIGTCSLDKVADEKACPRCTKTTQCGNECGECELCPGKTVADLPASCTPTGSGGQTGAGGGSANYGGAGNYGGNSAGGAPEQGGSGGTPPAYTCDNGETLCGPGMPSCGPNFYCSFGCCIEVVR